MLKLKEMFFHNMEELISFLQKEYGPTWYDRVFVKVVDRSAKVEDGKSMVKVRISDLDEASENMSFEDLENLMKSETKSSEIDDKAYEKVLEEYSEPRVVINVSSDGKKAYMTVFPGLEREMPSTDEILQAVENENVKYGIKGEIIKEVIEKKITLKPILIAEGAEPTKSKDAQLKLLFPPSGVKIKEVVKNGKIDYASMYEIAYCNKGETLAIKIPSERGKSGYDVFGNEIPSEEPRDISMKKFVGENVKLSEDGNSIVSCVAGQPWLSEDRKVNVREIYVVDGNLDYSIGNIDFLGTVWIKGNVEENFKIKAGKDVIVDGIVGEAEIEASGSIIVKGGVFGRSKGKLVSHKNFKAKFLNEALVISYGDVSVDEYIMNSRVISKGDLVVKGKGWITGGSVKASGNVIVNVIGSLSKVPTHVSAGVDFEFSRKLEEIEVNLQVYMAKLGEISALINKMFATLKNSSDRSQKGKLLRFMNHLEERKKETLGKIKKLTNELRVLKASLRVGENEKKSKIVVRQKCFDGTRITIVNETISIHSDIGPTIFSLDQVNWKIAAFSYKTWDVGELNG